MWWLKTSRPRGSAQPILSGGLTVDTKTPLARSSVIAAPAVIGQPWYAEAWALTAGAFRPSLMALKAAYDEAKRQGTMFADIPQVHNHSIITGPVSLLGGGTSGESASLTGEVFVPGGAIGEECRSLFVFDPFEMQVWNFRGNKWVALPDIPDRGKLLENATSATAWGGGAWGAMGSTLMARYGKLELVMYTNKPTNGFRFFEFDFVPGSWSEIYPTIQGEFTDSLGLKFEQDRIFSFGPWATTVRETDLEGEALYLIDGESLYLRYDGAGGEPSPYCELDFYSESTTGFQGVSVVQDPYVTPPSDTKSVRFRGNATAPNGTTNTSAFSGQYTTSGVWKHIGAGIGTFNNQWLVISALGIGAGKKIGIRRLIFRPSQAVSIYMSKAINYRGDMVWTGYTTRSEELFAYSWSKDNVISVSRANPIPRGVRKVGDAYSYSQQNTLTGRLHPHLECLRTSTDYVGGRNRYDSSTASWIEVPLHHQYRVKFDPNKNVMEADAAEAYVLRSSGTSPYGSHYPSFENRSFGVPYMLLSGVSHKGYMFHINFLGQLVRIDGNRYISKTMYDIPYGFPEFDCGLTYTDYDGEATTEGNDFGLVWPEPYPYNFEEKMSAWGRMGVGFWDAWARLEIVSIPPTGDSERDAKLSTMVGRKGYFTGYHYWHDEIQLEDLGDIDVANTNDVSYFSSGATLPAGTYRMTCIQGAVDINDSDGGNAFLLNNSNSPTSNWVGCRLYHSGADKGWAPTVAGTWAVAADCSNANAEQTLTFDHDGSSPIGVYFEDFAGAPAGPNAGVGAHADNIVALVPQFHLEREVQVGGRRHWAALEDGRHLFSCWLNPSTGLWERQVLPAGTALRSRYAFCGGFLAFHNGDTPVALRLFEYDGDLFALWVFAMNRAQGPDNDNYKWPDDASGVPLSLPGAVLPPSMVARFHYEPATDELVLVDKAVLDIGATVNTVIEVDDRAGVAWLMSVKEGFPSQDTTLTSVDLKTFGIQRHGTPWRVSRRLYGDVRYHFDNRHRIQNSGVLSFTPHEPQAFIDEVESAPLTNTVRVKYRLFSPDSRTLNVRVKFAYNAQRLGGFQAPVGFIAATEGQGSDGVWGLPSSSGVGTSHVFVHDIEKDLAPPILGDIQYEILPFDRADEAGTCLDIECDLWVQGIVHGCNLTAYGISVDGDPVATVNIPGTALCPVCSVSGVQTPGAVKVKSGNLSTLKLSVLDVCHNQGIGDTTCFFQQPVDGAAMWIVPKDSDGTVIMCEAVALPGQLVTFGNCLTSVGEVIGVSACYPQTVVPSGTVTISGPATVAYGDSLTLTLDGITGIAPPYTYQWYLNATPIVGATDVNYGPVLADFGDAGAYNLMVNGLYTSNTVTVAVTAAPPVLAPIPDMGVTIGDTLTISTQLLSGGEPITYQWYKDDVIIIGATALSYSKAGATTGDDGVYKIVATGPGGTTYQQATVSLAMAPAWVWYRFDEQPVTSTTLTDSSGNNRLSTLVSSFSRVDGAIVIPQSTGTTLRGARLNALMPLSFRNPPIAMMAWVKPAMRTDRNTAATYSYQPYPPNVLSNDYPGQGGHGFGVNVWAADGIYSAGSALIVAGFGNIAVPGGFAADTWYHVAISMGSTYKTQVWVNGVRIYTSNTVPGFTAIQSYLYTGRHNDDTNYSSRNNFAGAIDEARVYDRELSSAELNAIYLAGRSRPTPYDLTGEGHYLYGDGFQVIGRNFN